MNHYRLFVMSAGALLLGGLWLGSVPAVAQQPDEPSADAQAESREQEQDQERARREAQRREESQRREAGAGERRATERDRASRDAQREPQDDQADTTRQARRNEASNRFDEDPRERDRSYSRYPSDPTDRAEERREGRQDEGGAWLGVFLAEGNNQQQGAFVRSVYPAGPAARAGFRPGDVIVSVDGQEVRDPQVLMERIERMEPRQQTEFVVLRGGQQVSLRTTLGDRQMVMFQGDNRGREEYGGDDARRGSGSNREDDDFANVPPYAMELEHHRRMAEQHQRIEDMISKLHEEVRQLREELRTARRQ